MNHSDLLFLFLSTGLFTIGGGLAAIPILKEALVPNQLTPEEFLSMIAVCQSAPGSIGANMATYVGVSESGIGGAFVAVFALIVPSFITITIIARFLPRFSSYAVVKSIFTSVRPAVTGLILSVALTLTVSVLLLGPGAMNFIPFVIFALIILLHIRFRLQSITLIAIGALCGMVLL